MKMSSPRDLRIVLPKFHENRLRIDREIGEKHAIQVNLTADIAISRNQNKNEYFGLNVSLYLTGMKN